MKSNALLCLLLLPLLFACSQKKSVNTETSKVETIEFDTLTYEKRMIDSRCFDSSCCYVLFKWIVPKDKQLQKDLVRFASDSKFDDLDEYEKATCSFYEKQAKDVIVDWEKSGNKEEDEPDIVFTIIEHSQLYKPILNNEQYLVMEFFFYEGGGGSHGDKAIIYYTYRKRDKKWLTLDDVLLLQKGKEINKVLDKVVREKHHLNATEPIDGTDENGSCINTDTISYTQNFTLDEKGITFHYGEYEVGPYACGFYSLFVPYEKLKPFLNTNFKY